jgi:hypothetical protein
VRPTLIHVCSLEALWISQALLRGPFARTLPGALHPHAAAMAAMTSTLGQAKLGCSTGALRARQPAAARAAPVQTRAAAGGTALNEMVPDRCAASNSMADSNQLINGPWEVESVHNGAKLQPASAPRQWIEVQLADCAPQVKADHDELAAGGRPGPARHGDAGPLRLLLQAQHVRASACRRCFL